MFHSLRLFSKRAVLLGVASLAIGVVGGAASRAASINFEQANLGSQNGKPSTPSISLSLGGQQDSVCGYVGIGPDGALNFQNAPAQQPGSTPLGSGFAPPADGSAQYSQPISDFAQLQSGGPVQTPASNYGGNPVTPGVTSNLPTPQPCAPSHVDQSLWSEACGGGHAGSSEPSYNAPEPKSGHGRAVPAYCAPTPHHATFVPLPAPLAGTAVLLGMFALVQLRRTRRTRAAQLV